MQRWFSWAWLYCFQAGDGWIHKLLTSFFDAKRNFWKNTCWNFGIQDFKTWRSCFGAWNRCMYIVVYTVGIFFNDFLHSWWRHHFWCYLIQQGSFWLRPLRITAGVALLALGLRPCGVGGSHQLIGPKLGGHIDARGLPGGIPFLEVKTEAEIHKWLVMNLCAFCYQQKKSLFCVGFNKMFVVQLSVSFVLFTAFLRYNDLFGRGRLLWSSSWASSKEKPSDAEGFWGLPLDLSMSCRLIRKQRVPFCAFLHRGKLTWNPKIGGL